MDGSVSSARISRWPPRGVHVVFGDVPAYVSDVSPKQVNALLPQSFTDKPVTVHLVVDGAGSDSSGVETTELAPAILLAPGTTYAAGVFADGTPLGSPGTQETHMPKPGDRISIFAVDLGPTYPAEDGFAPSLLAWHL